MLVTPRELAMELGVTALVLRGWLRRRWPQLIPYARWLLTPEQVSVVRAEWPRRRTQFGNVRDVGGGALKVMSDECYVLDLCDEVLGCASERQASFPWLRGDLTANGRRVPLRVDGYWPSLALVVEYRELQHDQPVAFFDKPDQLTATGVPRGEQRRVYDIRRDVEIPAHGENLVIIRPADLDADRRGRLRRNRVSDTAALGALLPSGGAAHPVR